MIQGFSVGGEIPGSALFTIEHVPSNKRGVSIGFVFMCITLGNTLGALVGFILTSLLNQEQMMAWGWRIPFIIGFCVGIVSYIIRKKAIETPVFLSMMRANQLHQKPFRALLKLPRQILVRAVLLTAATSSIISLFLYLPTYLSRIVNINVSHAYLINLISFLSFALMTLCWGKLSDVVNRRRILIIGASLLIVLSYPLFYGLTAWGEVFVWIFAFSFSMIGGMINGSYVVLIAESFPANLRYSGFGFSYSLGVALFGGIAPLAFTGLIEALHIAEAPAFYVLGCAVLTLTAILFCHPRKSC